MTIDPTASTLQRLAQSRPPPVQQPLAEIKLAASQSNDPSLLYDMRRAVATTQGGQNPTLQQSSASDPYRPYSPLTPMGYPETMTPYYGHSQPNNGGGLAAIASGNTPENGSLKQGILETARYLGVDPVDLATAISYETAGTFDPVKRGPTTQWGQHRGLIQFGEPQAKKYGVNWGDPLGSQLGQNGAIAKYLLDTGVRPGMGLMDIYSAINAGGVGRYRASDANNGGAPGTVADKVNNQMTGHRKNAMKLMGY